MSLASGSELGTTLVGDTGMSFRVFSSSSGSYLASRPEEAREASCPAVWGTVALDKELFCTDIQKCTLEIHWPAPCEGHAPPRMWEHFELRRHVLNKEKTVSCSTTSLLTFPFLKVHLGIWHILQITLCSLSREIWMQSSFLLKTAWIIFCQFHLAFIIFVYFWL